VLADSLEEDLVIS